jgi:hypothetical protein
LFIHFIKFVLQKGCKMSVEKEFKPNKVALLPK